MEGLEYTWKEHVGDVTFDKSEWKKNPEERFKILALNAASMTDWLTERQRNWLESNLYRIPNYEQLNPIAVVFGYASCEHKKFSPKQFSFTERLLKKAGVSKKIDVAVIDVIRYIKAWERWYEDRVFD